MWTTRSAARLYSLLSYGDSQEKPWEKGKKLSGLTVSILHVIITGAELPDAVAARALAYLRSQMLSAAEDDTNRNTRVSPDGIAVQWLKA